MLNCAVGFIKHYIGLLGQMAVVRRCWCDSRPALTAPVNALSALFATVCARPGPFRPVKTASSGAWSRF